MERIWSEDCGDVDSTSLRVLVRPPNLRLGVSAGDLEA